MFFLRAGLFDRESLAALEEMVGACSEAASDEIPRKRATLRAFRRRFQLGDVLHKAVALAQEADTLPGHSTGALRLRQTAVAYALLVNSGDRQGDLRLARIGHEIVRDAEGTWRHGLRQGKTGSRKEMEALWPGTCRLLDDHVLADRPAWQIGSRVADLEGANLLTLSDAILHEGFLNRRLEQDFQLEVESISQDKPTEKLSGHLIRTLIVDTIRRVGRMPYGPRSTCWAMPIAPCRRFTAPTSPKAKPSRGWTSVWWRSRPCTVASNRTVGLRSTE
jgi:hypothetical protein